MRNVFFETTKRTLYENKNRTAVTLIGVILSVAMITGVLFFTSSIHNFLVETTKEDFGNWSISVKNMPDDMKSDAYRLGLTYGTSEAVGYSTLEEGSNPQKPFIFLENTDKNMEGISNIELIEGRMPKNDGEIVLPEHLNTNGGVAYTVGETITLNLGARIDIQNGNEMEQQDSYEPEREIFVASEKKEFVVVGICKRPSTEPYMAPGYTAITKDAEPIMDGVWTYFGDDNYVAAEGLVNKYYSEDDNVVYNKTLLSVKGSIANANNTSILFTSATVLLVLISIGGCMLMYNAFEISSRERRSHYEILASVGATENQLRRAALYEGAFFGIGGIPIGMIVGWIGSFIAIKLFGPKIADIISPETDIQLSLFFGKDFVILALLISIIVVQLSIMGPAYKVGKTKPIREYEYGELSNQTQKAVVKPPKIMFKLFGAEGMLAGKNFKRNSRQYRAVIISMVMSILLFVTTSGLTFYAQNSIDAMIGDEDGYDIVYSGDSAINIKEAYVTLSKAESVTKSSYIQEGQIKAENSSLVYDVFIVDDTTFSGYLKEWSLSGEEYFDNENPKAIAMSNMKVYNSKTGRIEEREIFTGDLRPYSIKGYVGSKEKTLAIGAYVDSIPYDMKASVNTPVVIMSESASKSWKEDLAEKAFTGKALFKSDNAERSYTVMSDLCKKNGLPNDNLENVQKQRDEAESLLTIVRVFSYGFILLLSLIAVTNVFNTVSSNLESRKSEFATLIALGMSPKAFIRMIYYECLLLGVRTLMYGIPMAIIGLFIMFKSMPISIITGYIMPVKSIVLSIVSVFAIVIVVMIYATGKLRDSNVANALKNNL